MYSEAVKCRLILASEINAFFMFSVIGKLPNRLEKKQIFMISDGVLSKINNKFKITMCLYIFRINILNFLKKIRNNFALKNRNI